jgi:hypothetical protein
MRPSAGRGGAHARDRLMAPSQTEQAHLEDPICLSVEDEADAVVAHPFPLHLTVPGLSGPTAPARAHRGTRKTRLAPRPACPVPWIGGDPCPAMKAKAAAPAAGSIG